MTATEKLRQLLDERGVEWTYGDGTVSFSSGKHWCHAWAYNDGAMCVSMGYFTPEQAVAATLGSCNCSNSERTGTCRRVLYKPTGVLVCSECGAGIPKQLDKYCYLHYCPNCGRKVVDE